MLQAAMEQVAEGVVIVDLEGHFLLANRAAQEIVGMGPVELSPSDWSAVYGCFRPDKVTPYPSEELPLNRAMRTGDERFVTLVLALLDPERRSIVYGSAGHIPGYVMDASGNVRETLPATGTPLGIFEESDFTSSPEIPLRDGETLLLLTDGAAEAQNEDGDFFETERVLRVVAAAREEPARAIVHRIDAAVEQFAPDRPQRDDITAVVCKVGSGA